MISDVSVGSDHNKLEQSYPWIDFLDTKFKTATLLPGDFETPEQGKNETIKANVLLLNGSTTTAYIKPNLTPRKIFVELICAIIGRDLGIPIPQPILVQLNNENWHNLKQDEIKIVFGVESLPYPNLLRNIKSNSILKKLSEAKESFEALVFDECIFNCDRHPGNVLFDGGDKFYFIDHDLAIHNDCFASTDYMPYNQLIKYFLHYSDANKLELIYKMDAELIKKYLNYQFKDILKYINLVDGFNSSDVQKISEWLESRACVFIKHLKFRLNLQQQSLL